MIQPIKKTDLNTYPRSEVTIEGTTYSLVKDSHSQHKFLAVQGQVSGFTGLVEVEEYRLYPLTPENAAVLRSRLPWLNPTPLGTKSSFGYGDRLGSATPGHIQAARGSDLAPIFAQQSVRENSRIGRTPQQVLDDAVWGLFQAGWREPWGADADHVKEVSHLAPFVAAGYTFYTIDPSDHVDNAAQTDSLATLRQKAQQLPWDAMETTYAAMQERYCRAPFKLASLSLDFSEETLLRALVKYGRAILHAVTITRELAARLGEQRYDLEMSVDETDTPTSTHEHFFIANELISRRLPLVSLAPRFVGKFQKGVDYIGDLAAFEAELINHVAIMRHFDGYKLSIHTGSDKFSLYPIIAKYAAERVHVKTAGTSYLEILRVIADQDPPFFRRILDYSRSQFEYDRKTYFLDAQLNKVPPTESLADAELPQLLEQFDARQVLHVTFGSVLDQFGQEVHAFAAAQEAAYQQGLERHFNRHLAPFKGEG